MTSFHPINQEELDAYVDAFLKIPSTALPPSAALTQEVAKQKLPQTNPPCHYKSIRNIHKAAI